MQDGFDFLPGSFGFVHFQIKHIWDFLCIYSADCIFLQSNPFDRKGVSWYTDGENQTFGGVLNAELYNPLTEREYLRSVGGFCAFRAVNNYCEVTKMYFYKLKHVRDNGDGTTSSCMLGFFSSMNRIREAIAYYRTVEGFRDYPDCFVIKKDVLDFDDYDFEFED